MLELDAADVDVLAADERDHDADGADRDVEHRHLLDLGEPRVEVPRAGEEDLLLQAAAAAAVEERLRVLEVVVPGDDRARDFTGLDRPAVERGDDADLVGLDVRQLEVARRDRVLMRVLRRDNLEERAVDAVRAGGEDRELAALFAAAEEEFARVLEVVALDHAAEDAAGRNRRARGGNHERDLAGRDDHDGRFDHAELPEEVAEVQPGRERFGLVTGLAVERDELSGGQRARGEFLDDDADLVLANDREAEEQRRHPERGE